MAKITRTAGKHTTAGDEMMKQVIGKVTSPRGREIWHLTSGGAHQTLVTTNTSARAMDEAIELFAPALRRLADR